MFDVRVSFRDGLYVAFCPELGAEALGETEEKAIESLKHMAEMAFKEVVPIYRHLN
jgi:predicted RNase H-like HicB family nuclease